MSLDTFDAPRLDDCTPLPAYQSHKRVEAAEIARIQTREGEPWIVLHLKQGDGTTAAYRVPAVVAARYEPVPGDFLVRYPDCYLSVSPRQAFLEGYQPVVT